MHYKNLDRNGSSFLEMYRQPEPLPDSNPPFALLVVPSQMRHRSMPKVQLNSPLRHSPSTIGVALWSTVLHMMRLEQFYSSTSPSSLASSLAGASASVLPFGADCSPPVLRPLALPSGAAAAGAISRTGEIRRRLGRPPSPLTLPLASRALLTLSWLAALPLRLPMLCGSSPLSCTPAPAGLAIVCAAFSLVRSHGSSWAAAPAALLAVVAAPPSDGVA